MMDDTVWISWFMGIFSALLLLLVLRMRKTDPVFGCDKYKRKGCGEVAGRNCGYPACTELERHRSGNEPHP